MKAFVVYDSTSGYTELIARAIGAALEPSGEVSVVHVGTPGSHILAGLDLLVVGGPTEAHGMTAPMRRWLDGLGKSALKGVAVATFCTRLHWPKLLSGSAAEAIADHIRDAGGYVVVKPESFFVQGKENPAPGPEELAHVSEWVSEVIAALPVAVA